MDILLNLGFVESARAEIVNNQFVMNITRNENSKNILYAFVIKRGEDIADWHVRYIGHSRKTFRNRMVGYQQGNGRAVNNRIHVEMSERCRNGEIVIVFCLSDLLNMEIHGLHIDISAGLEYSLIDYYASYNAENNHPPLQNIAGNRNYASIIAENVEEVAIADQNEEEQNYINNHGNNNPLPILYSFGQVLGTTYWNNPFINIPVRFSELFGQTGENVLLDIYNGNQLIRQISVIINREAVPNRSPRFILTGEYGRWFQNWKHENYIEGGVMMIDIVGRNQISIRR
jgi:hypothetical protein